MSDVRHHHQRPERGCAVCPQRNNIPHLTIVSENATADTPRECREMGSAIRTPLLFFKAIFFNSKAIWKKNNNLSSFRKNTSLKV